MFKEIAGEENVGIRTKNVLKMIAAEIQKLNTETSNEKANESAKKVLEEAEGHVKTAIVMVLTGSGKDEANSLLSKAKGHISKALDINKQHE